MALAYGLPVVASRAGGLADLLCEYPIGTTFDRESPEELAAAVCRLHEEPDVASLERNIRRLAAPLHLARRRRRDDRRLLGGSRIRSVRECALAEPRGFA